MSFESLNQLKLEEPLVPRPPIRDHVKDRKPLGRLTEELLRKEELAPLNIDVVTIASGSPTVNIYHPRTLIIEGGTPLINVYCDGSTIVLRGGTPDIRCHNDVFVNFRLEETDYEMSL